MAKRTPELIYCADGNPSFARAAVEAGFRYGARLPSTVYEPVWFADQDWKTPCRESYMRALAEHRPAIATVLDWEREEQWHEVLSWATEAAQYCSTLVIIPKLCGTLGAIPGRIGGAEVVLGYSVPTSYGGSGVPLWEFGSRLVHLLGGSPQRQMELTGYLNVVSVDGNMAHQQAHRCRFWSRRRGPKGHWIQLADTGDTRHDGANLAAFRRSLANIRQAWADHVSGHETSCRPKASESD